jgi:chromatin segregation and condensation protein Rec8/ScpA/Scc1 (kleisin family)
LASSLAILELIREKRILVEQSDDLADAQIIVAPEEHKKTYAGASLHLLDESPAERPATE